MKKGISVFLIVISLIVISLIVVFSGCKKVSSTPSDTFNVKSGDTFLIKVSMEDSGMIKSMALTFYTDDNAFEIVEGNWLNHNAIIADFNKENKDAVIAFKEEVNYCGEIFKLEVRAKKELTIIDGMFDVDTVLKNEQEEVACKGVTISCEEQ